MTSIKDVFVDLPQIYHFKDDSFIICDDSLKILKKIKSNTIDLIFADPPYNIGKDFEKVKIDKEIYLDWFKQWVDEAFRVLKTSGTIYIMAATQFMPYIDSYIDSKYIVLSRIIWRYDSSGVQARKYFGSMYEPILMCVKNRKEYKFNSESVMVEARTGAERRLIDYRKTPPQPYRA